MIKLTQLEPGQNAQVRRIEGGHGLISRLASLGFTPGAPISVTRAHAGSGPILVSIRGSQVALGSLEAAHVMVSQGDESAPSAPAQAVIALAGQPNVGKSTVFNILTGLNQHVGNWTGKTVEKKTGQFTFQDRTLTLVDLPGTYSLTAASEEERIARDFIIREKPDLVIAVVDAATLERSLYLVTELLLLPTPVILALNMMDVAKQEGIQIEPHVLESALGIPVIPMSASRGQGVAELLEAAMHCLSGLANYQPKRPTLLKDHQEILDQLQILIKDVVEPQYPVDWVALKLLEGDEELLASVKARLTPADWEKVDALLYQHEDGILEIASLRYEWIDRMIRAAVVRPRVGQGSLTTRLDQLFTHPFWGFLALIVVLGAVFFLTYAIGTPVQDFLDARVSLLAATIRATFSAWPTWLVESIAGGVLGGVGMVLTFLPILAIFYFFLGSLEDTGYLSRIAYLTDRWMHRMGLHGKSFLPILLGFGCNVPAVLGTRIIESKRARLLTILLVPLIPCTARLTVVAILAPLFFGTSAFWVVWGLVGFNLLLMAGLGLVLHRFAFEDEHVAFIMELPLYHLPNMKTIGVYVWNNLMGFLQKAGTTILMASLVVWVLSYFPTGNMSESWLAFFGQYLEPIGAWMGLPWPALVAILTSVAAKENTIATLGILNGDLGATLPTLLSTPAALALLVFQMLFLPCVGTIAAIRQESSSLRWTLISLGIMLALSLGVSVAVYQIGRLF